MTQRRSTSPSATRNYEGSCSEAVMNYMKGEAFSNNRISEVA